MCAPSEKHIVYNVPNGEENMKRIIKIVLTGGPCGGKSSAISFLEAELKKRGIAVLTAPETAAELFAQGKSPQKNGSYNFHRELFSIQLKREKELEGKAAALPGDKAVILLDRGLLDSMAYTDHADFERYCAEFSQSEDKLRSSYDAVFHLVTAAKGAEDFYTIDGTIRTESLEPARRLDSKLISVWTGTPHLRMIDNSTDFDGKLKRLLNEVLAVVGDPEPIEIERKFLIEMPELSLLENMEACRKVTIEQAYFQTKEDGKFRIRKRGSGEQAVYIKTVKKKLNEMSRIEIEEEIPREEYDRLLLEKNGMFGIIVKDRYCFVSGSQYFELDVFPFWTDRAVLELELLSEDQSFTLPDIVKPIKEVTNDKNYKNSVLSQRYRFLFDRS